MATETEKEKNLADYEAYKAARTARPVNCGRIASHSGWRRGRWVTDKCSCGHTFSVPAGEGGKYQCNCCADRAEGIGDY